jgi:hypothetical protein
MAGTSERFQRITDPKEIQHAAIRLVIAEENRLGRGPARDTRPIRGAPADVESLGRIIEVKAFGRFAELRAEGTLLFTPPQLLVGAENAAYFVYVVENVAQGDPTKFEIRLLHGDDLRRLFAGAKQRSYVTVHVADYLKMPRLDE